MGMHSQILLWAKPPFGRCRCWSTPPALHDGNLVKLPPEHTADPSATLVSGSSRPDTFGVFPTPSWGEASVVPRLELMEILQQPEDMWAAFVSSLQLLLYVNVDLLSHLQVSLQHLLQQRCVASLRCGTDLPKRAGDVVQRPVRDGQHLSKAREVALAGQLLGRRRSELQSLAVGDLKAVVARVVALRDELPPPQGRDERRQGLNLMFLADGVGVLLHQAQISPLILVPLRQQLHLAALVRHFEMVDVVQLDV
mmetsp:Transcript_3653/g.13449  ORF Transcript_3653/g.13449 Transcript_3653/m.13449 type:complete len:253 (+) Transcript_3653:163-921(+)